MAFSILRFSSIAPISSNITKSSTVDLFPQFGSKATTINHRHRLSSCCATAKQQKSGGGAPPATKKKKRSSNRSNNRKGLNDDGFEIAKSSDVELLESPSQSLEEESPYSALPLPNPPAGFALDEQGRILMASDKRIATLVDSTNNLPLDCVIRRVFQSSQGDDCMLLCPVDTPIQILKSVNVEGWSAVGDEEIEAILPTAAYALAKIHMHLVYSGFCYTARGGFCYTEEDIFEFHIDTCEDVDGLPTEGVEIACFNLDGAHYMIYTPSDPLLFVAVKDKKGVLQIADDELLEDPAIISAIDEETEFNALVEEETALLESLMGKR